MLVGRLLYQFIQALLSQYRESYANVVAIILESLISLGSATPHGIVSSVFLAPYTEMDGL